MVLRTCLIEELRSFGEELDREVDIADNLRRGPSNPIFRQRPGFGTTALIHHEGRASQRCFNSIDAHCLSPTLALACRWDQELNCPRKSLFILPRVSRPLEVFTGSRKTSEYHLIDLATGLSHGGFASLAGARQCAREKDLPAWVSSMAMFGSSTTIRGENNRDVCGQPRWWIHPGRPVTCSPPAMVGPTNDTQIYGRYFFRHRAVTTHRAHNSKAARALRRAAFKMNCQTAPVPFIP